MNDLNSNIENLLANNEDFTRRLVAYCLSQNGRRIFTHGQGMKTYGSAKPRRTP